jgi:hypothetical protein
MSYRGNLLRACLFGAALSFTAGFASTAKASDPLPGDAIGLPPNVNIALYYNVFVASGDFAPAHGSDVKDHSKLGLDVNVFRYVHTWGIDGMTVGAQVVVPINSFFGGTEVGGAHLSTQSGFQQPLLGVFAFPINDDANGRSVATGAWIFPPISSFNKNSIVNPSENLTTYELEAGFHQILLGDPKGSNLALEAWDEAYFYSNNTDTLAGGAGGPPATLREQPTDEVRVYLPYVINPATQLFVAPGFFQSFGGKQTYALHNFPVIADSGNRTNVSEFRFSAGQFISPTVQLEATGEYDFAGHGGFLGRSIQIRVLKFF